MKQMSLARWIDWDIYHGDGRRAYIGGREIECIKFQSDDRYDGIARILFVDADEYVAFPDRYAVTVDVEDEYPVGGLSERAQVVEDEPDDEADRLAREAHAMEMLEADALASDGDYFCSCCGENIGDSPFNPCASCGDGGLEGPCSDDEQQPDGLSERAQVVEDAVREDIERQNDEKHCAAIDIDGQPVGEADIRRLIRKVQSLATALMLSHFSLNQANADIAALQRAVAGRPVAAFTLTRKGYDSTRDMGV